MSYAASPTSSNSPAENYLKIATPATLAYHASRKKWLPARHLLYLDKRVTEFIRANREGRAKSRIMVVEIPVRHGKSEYLSRYVPAWFMSSYPHCHTILASYEAGFARTWGRKAREAFKAASEWTGLRLNKEAQAASEWQVGGYDGMMITAGIGGPVGGKTADLLLIDDPIKNAEEADSKATKDKHWDWWQSTGFVRLNPRGCAIVAMARWCPDDLIGRILGGNDGVPNEPVERIHLPAFAHADDEMGRTEGDPLWPERWPTEALERQRTTVGPYYWAALYDQDPRKARQTEWPEEWFGPEIWFDEWPRHDCGQKVVSLDSSKGKSGKKGDYSAFIKAQWHDGVLYVDADMDNRRDSTIIADTAVEIQKQWRPHIFGVEEEFGGDILGTDIIGRAKRRNLMIPLVTISTEGVAKEVRIRRLSPYMEQRMIRFKADSPGAKLLVSQLQEFPQGDHDDGPDALEMAIRLLIESGV